MKPGPKVSKWAGTVLADRIPKGRRLIMRSGGIPQNKKHRDFIRTLPCVLADDPRHECAGSIEAAHVGKRGKSQKSPDEETLPLCAGGHRTRKYALHKGEKTFWSYWIIPAKEFLIQQHVNLGVLHGTIREDSLWWQRNKEKMLDYSRAS